MNESRLVGMALATVGLIFLLIWRYRAYPLGLYIGLILIAVGFIIYIRDVYKPLKPGEKTENEAPEKSNVAKA